MTIESVEKLFRMKAKVPTYRTFLMRRARTFASPSTAQKSPARVMSIPIRIVVSAATSPCRSPNPLSM